MKSKLTIKSNQKKKNVMLFLETESTGASMEQAGSGDEWRCEESDVIVAV